jgi:hypothetical protein
VEAGGQPTTDDRILYTDWRGRHFNAAEAADPAVSGPEADPDGDDLVNGFEYAVGSNPRLADAPRFLPVFTMTELDTGTGPEPYGWVSLRIVWAAEDATVVAESGRNLVSWSPEPAGVVRVRTLDAGYGHATIHWSTTNPIDQRDQLFIRIRTGVR